MKVSEIKRKYTTITIPAPLFEKLKEKIRTTGFSSVSDYITYIMREMVSEIELNKGVNKKSSAAERSVLEKLHSLGYV